MSGPQIRRETFFVGGSYAGAASGQIMHGQMYVEVLTPEPPRHPYPLVMIHGRSQTSMNWLTTPDGRPGWADWFTGHGWTAVLVDQPAGGRSAWHPEINGVLSSLTAPQVEAAFTDTARTPRWPQAKLHTQWPGQPGGGRAGSPAFDQFYASQVPSANREVTERAMQAAGAALLDRIGPAILLAHSHGAASAWLIADARPGLVKGIVALEPNGPPFRGAAIGPDGPDRVSGLTTTPLTYDPPVTPAAPLAFEQQGAADGPGLLPCWLQAGEPRRLANLAGIPVMIVTGEASYHMLYDHCTARYLSQAGVANTVVRLGEHGIHGNGHMLMLESNSDEIAGLVEGWLTSHVQ